MRTIGESAVYSETIQNSRFIGWTYRFCEESQLPALQAEARKKWPAATHYTWAYRIQPGRERASDDGEPHATAGLPMLHIIQKHDLIDTLVMVIRYFGGTKLGRGGLVRAYQTVCQGALDLSRTALVCPQHEISLTVAYDGYAEVIQLLRHHLIHPSAEFSESVAIRFACSAELWSSLLPQLKSTGDIEYTVGAERLLIMPEPE